MEPISRKGGVEDVSQCRPSLPGGMWFPQRKPVNDHAGARTQDLPLKRRLLYRLSYAISSPTVYQDPDPERPCG